MTATPIPILASIAGLAPGCEAWLVDIWGVMHNGTRAFEAACAACRTFRSQGGVVLLISNAPRPFSAVIPALSALGVPTDAYDAGVTSGDVTRSIIEQWQGRPLLHVGPERDKGLFEGFDVQIAAPESAEVVVCSGLYDDTKETPADYAGLFAGLLARGVPMICANPDMLVERGGHLVYCAGALAAEYEAKGGQVIYAGKPHLPIYDRALAMIEAHRGQPVAKRAVLAIGDGVNTDLLGAHGAGLRSVFIASGVHVTDGLTEAALLDLFAGRPFKPVAALAALAW
ncbi:MAG: TIGR01459 family HAD-type hydrolase [Hyphomicrobiaceae bacterium]|nr:MAG: TIGR01459 family HAD-type hydrolase [Hyphomicrobiaceae bacterium]